MLLMLVVLLLRTVMALKDERLKDILKVRSILRVKKS